MWHFLAETTQQDATQGLNGGRQSVYQATDGTRIISPARPQPEPTRAPNRKRHSYVSAHPSPKHLDREAAPAQPAFRTPGISRIATRPQAARRRHARQAASRIPNSMSTKPPTPCPPNPNATPTRHFAFSRKSSRTFPCRGQDARTAARPKRIPRRKRSPPWSSKHLNAATATKFSTRNTPPRCCGPNAPTAEAEHIRTRPR